MGDPDRSNAETSLWRALSAEKAERLSETSALLRQIAHLWMTLGITLLALAVTIVLSVFW